MMVLAKFRCLEAKAATYGDVVQYSFCPVSDDGIPENQRFHKYTPGGKIELTVDNPAVSFEAGQEYYVNFTPAKLPAEIPAPPPATNEFVAPGCQPFPEQSTLGESVPAPDTATTGLFGESLPSGPVTIVDSMPKELDAAGESGGQTSTAESGETCPNPDTQITGQETPTLESNATTTPDTMAAGETATQSQALSSSGDAAQTEGQTLGESAEPVTTGDSTGSDSMESEAQSE